MASRKRFLPNLGAKKSASAEPPASHVAASSVQTPSDNNVGTGNATAATVSSSAPAAPTGVADSRPATTAASSSAPPSSQSDISDTSHASLVRPGPPTPLVSSPVQTSTVAARPPAITSGNGGAGTSTEHVSSSNVSTSVPPSERAPSQASVASATSSTSQSSGAAEASATGDSVLVAANVDVPSTRPRSRKRSAPSQTASQTATTAATATDATTVPAAKKTTKRAKKSTSTSGGDAAAESQQSKAAEKKAGAKKRSKSEPRGVLTEAPEPTKIRMRDLVRLNPTANPMAAQAIAGDKPAAATAAGLLLDIPDVSLSAESNPSTPSPTRPATALAPQVRVAEDGSIVIDESSLLLQTTASEKALVEEREVVYEQANSATYSSFKKRDKVDRWTTKETDKFYDILRQVGTDFSMMAPAFPTKTRRQLKNKFKKEEKSCPVKVAYSLRCRKPIDMELFKRPAPPAEEKAVNAESGMTGTSGAPAENSGAPAENSGAPAENSGAPAENSGAPSENSAILAENSPASNENASVPSTEALPGDVVEALQGAGVAMATVTAVEVAAAGETPFAFGFPI